MDLTTIVWGSFTIRDILLGAGLLVGLMAAIPVLKKIFSPRRENAHIQQTRCPECGWQGQVSRHAGVCPRCNSPLGDRSAKPPAR